LTLKITLGLTSLAIGSYLYGSICWAIILTRIKAKSDIRDLGDGNPGAYNVNQTIGKKYGFLVMLLDCTKGLIPAIIATTVDFDDYQPWAIGLAAICSVFGHCYPIYFKFRGGNGYSTIFGFMLIYNPWMVLEWGIFVFILTLIFKYIRPMQMIAITLTAFFSYFIPWNFYWRNFGPLLTIDMAMGSIPLIISFVALIQLPKFSRYFYGIYKGTEEKMFFFSRRSSEQSDNTIQKQ